jgi:predicted nuclease with TOPRIM domain
MLRKENNSLKKKNVEIEAKYESQEQRIKALELLIQKLAQEIK